jgi:L-seryl-tRNA(Ser) seleniumtransferase
MLASLNPEIVTGETAIGGGSTPDQVLPTFVIRLRIQHATHLERKLRLGEPPVIARIEKECLVLDMRTVGPEEEDSLAQAILTALR